MAVEKHNLGTQERLQIEEGTKPSPDVMEVVYLDEIAGRLADLNTSLSRLADIGSHFESKLASLGEKVDAISHFLDDTSYKGDILIVKKPITGGTGNKKVTCNKKWYEYTLFNDGPDDVYVESSAKSMSDTGINMGDQITAKSKRGSIKPVWVRCVKDETATVRVTFKT